jgi:XTP/dITP diphosphohydrolase
LNVIALPDELGLYSARFGGEGLNYQEKCELLLQKMQEVENRNASFSCVLVCYFSPDEYYFFEGQLQGAIGHKILGTEGFGFDPVFHPSNAPEEKTLAELPEWKQINSHRAQSCP